jgi:hypothetical protein
MPVYFAGKTEWLSARGIYRNKSNLNVRKNKKQEVLDFQVQNY